MRKQIYIFHTIIAIIFSSFPLLVRAQAQEKAKKMLQITTIKATNATEILAKYDLLGSTCCEKKMLEINKIASLDASIAAKKTVLLPIYVYPFNGRNIRSSVTVGMTVARKIESYNTKMQKIGIRKTSYKQDKILWVAHSDLFCASEKLKPIRNVIPKTEADSSKQNSMFEQGEKAKSHRTYAIFGKKYARVPLVNTSLKGKVFYVESGHGGPDPGAEAKLEGRTLCEDEYAYDIALRVARNLISMGGTVHIVTRDPTDGIRDSQFLLCDKDEQTYPDLKVPAPQKERLFQRSDAINLLAKKYQKKGITDQRLIVLHVDSRSKNQQTDVFLYYKEGDDESKRITKSIFDNLEKRYQKYRDYHGTMTARDLHMLRECETHSVYVELGNIRNATDQKRLMLAKNRQIIADWLTEGFVK